MAKRAAEQTAPSSMRKPPSDAPKPPVVVMPTPMAERMVHTPCRRVHFSLRNSIPKIRPTTGARPIITPEKEAEVIEMP